MGLMPDLQMIPMVCVGPASGFVGDDLENLLLRAIDGQKTLQQLADAVGLEISMAQRLVGGLMGLGVVAEAESQAGSQGRAVRESVDRSGTVRVVSQSIAPRSDETATLRVTEAAVNELYARLEQSNLYELLGVSPLASRSEIRTAYFSLSKKFHPDTVFRNTNAALTHKLSRIFDKLTFAYDTLSGKSKREAYDNSIGDVISLYKLEESLKKAASGSSRDSGPGSHPTAAAPDSTRGGAPSAVSARQTSPVIETSTESFRRTPVQDRVSIDVRARVSRIPATRSSYTADFAPGSTGQRDSTGSPAASSSAPAAPAWQEMRQSGAPSAANSDVSGLSAEEQELRRQNWKRERLKRALGGGASAARRAGGGVGAESETALMENAKLAMEHREYELAMQYIQELLRRDGENPIAIQLLREAQSGRVKLEISELIRRGRFEQSGGNMQAALELYERAFKLDVRQLEARHHIAALLLETRKDIVRALQLSREVIAMGGRRVQYFVTLADLYELTKDFARAIEAVQRAVEISPENRELKDRLRSMTKK